MTKMEHINTLERMKTWSKDLSDEEIEAIAYALKTLNQEPCEDAVSRAEVVDELNRLGRNAFKDDTDYDNFFAFLDSLPFVAPTQEWIPCSEAMPLERRAVLVWNINNTYCAYLEDGKWYIFGAYDLELKEVTAWMPLPKQYEGDKKDD